MDTTTQLARSSSLVRSGSPRPRLPVHMRSETKTPALHSLALGSSPSSEQWTLISLSASSTAKGGTFLQHCLALSIVFSSQRCAGRSAVDSFLAEPAYTPPSPFPEDRKEHWNCQPHSWSQSAILCFSWVPIFKWCPSLANFQHNLP